MNRYKPTCLLESIHTAQQIYPIKVTEIGEFIRHKLCERRFKLAYHNEEEASKVPFAVRILNPIDPILQESGRLKEEDLAQELVQAGFRHITENYYLPNAHPAGYPTWANFIETLADIREGERVFAREVKLDGNIGDFPIQGRLDFIILLWVENRPMLRIVEAKASHKDRTYHKIQVTLYRMLIEQLITNNPLIINGQQMTKENIECSVIRIDEAQNRMQSILQTPPITDLSQEETDIRYLLADDGPIMRIVNTPIDQLDYKLDLKCDDCIFDTNCLPESSLHRCLELLSIDSSDIRVLKENAVRTIDDLANLTLTSAQAQHIEANPAFTQNLEILKVKASARRSTLPRGIADPRDFQVQLLPYQGTGQLPTHSVNGDSLIRIFLAIDYDYVEARIVALSAHVTSSSDEIETRANQNPDGSWNFDPVVYEVNSVGMSAPLGDTPLIRYMQTPWSKNFAIDQDRELHLILDFFNDLVTRIREVANGRAYAPIHFYVWSRQEITHLIDACSRIDTRLLGPLSELFGCRLPLDQLIFSCLYDEVQQRYALGWTSRGLSVATSLSWFGKRYHWTRRVNNQNVWLEQIFNQDIFDFKTSLKYRDNQTWEEDLDAEGPNVRKYLFELRSRFNDSLSVPYWHAAWGSLPDRNRPGLNPLVRRAIDRYNQASTPGYLLEFLKARVLALRWLEEKISTKNADIIKTPLEIDNLPHFTLGVITTDHAATDFLRLENHIKRTDWITAHLVPPKTRVSLGETIPINRITKTGDRLFAYIDLTGYGIDLNALQVSTTLAEGSFVRVSECNQNPAIGQRLYQLIDRGWTCIIKSIDWVTGVIELSYLTSNESRYIVRSIVSANRLFTNATIDVSISDFVARRVDEHLTEYSTSPIYNWFDPRTPNIPRQVGITEALIAQIRALLGDLLLPGAQHQLDNSQIDVILDGLNTRVQLVQGPPGTGKTITTAIAILVRILARRTEGDVILVSATTHTALDNLLSVLSTFLDQFNQLSRTHGLNMPSVTMAKVMSSDPEEADALPEAIHTFEARDSSDNIEQYTENTVTIIGGTPSALLKMYKILMINDTEFSAKDLIVDEASMMVFPHFLAVASLISDQGTIMLTGDHRQLAPIISQDWEDEDRPPVVLFKPYRSAYAVVKDIAAINLPPESVLVSSLNVTYRLPPPLVDLISKLYRLDNIDLHCTREIAQPNTPVNGENIWQTIWQNNYGLFLILHSERQSQRHNNVESDIIQLILAAGGQRPNNSIAIVTPHRAQRRLLVTQLTAQLTGANAPIGVIDTVERLQGGQRSVVILSAVESDPSYIGNNVGFILDLNRSNVAFSRAQDRLIVICSENLINYIPTESDQYDATMLWKTLRTICSAKVGETTVRNERVQVFTYQQP